FNPAHASRPLPPAREQHLAVHPPTRVGPPPHPPGTFVIGAVLGDTYEVVGQVGRGGMGTVRAARHLRLPVKRVAIKVLSAGIAQNSDAYTPFRREAEIASRIGHPTIIEVLDFNVLPDGTPYLVLEFLEGSSICRLISLKQVSY